MTLNPSATYTAQTLSRSYARLIKEERLWQTSIEHAIELVAYNCRGALGASRCTVWLQSQNAKDLVCRAITTENGEHCSKPPIVINTKQFSRYLLALDNERMLAVNNAQGDPRTQELTSDYWQPHGINSVLAGSLRNEGHARGILSLEQTDQPRFWTAPEINYAASIADLLSQLVMYYSLREKERRYRTVFDSTGDALILIKDNSVYDCNAAALRLFRCSRQYFIGQPKSQLWSIPERSPKRTYERFEWQQTRRDNTTFYADVTMTLVNLDHEEHLIASVRDISEQRDASNQLVALNSLHQAIFDGASYCIIATDLNGIIHTFNRAAEAHLLYGADSVIGRLTPLAFHSKKELAWRADTLTYELGYELQPSFETLVAKARLGQPDEYEWMYQRQDGSEFPVSLAVAPLRDNNQTICGFLFMAADITERRRANAQLIDSQREMERRANHDGLTGLPNRARLHDVAAIAIHNAQKHIHKTALMLLDLNRFKDINDTLGHAIGDQILKEIANRLQTMLIRHGAYLYRLGGDEFAILMAKVAEGDEAISLASFIDASLRRPIEADGITLEIGGSIGIAVYPDHGESSHALLRCADVAMYSAKANSQPLAFYDSTQDAHSPRRLMLMAELGNAIRQDELILHYQPKVDIQSGQCLCCEALIRWHHPKLGLVPPNEFIPMAEMSEIIKPLSEWVLSRSLSEVKTWHDKGIPMKVAINLSARNLIDYDFPGIIEKHLKRTGFPANHLELEITESALISDPERSLQIIQRIHDLGVHFAIDDFGTGYSSMAYLKRLPLSILKIDRTFVSDMMNDEQDATIIKSTIGLAHSFGLSVVAEGVEDTDTLAALSELQCETSQGFIHSPPLPMSDFQTWYSRHTLSDYYSH